MGCGSSTHRAWRPRAPDVQVFNDPVPSPKVSPTAKVTLVRKGCDIDFSRVMASKEGINALRGGHSQRSGSTEENMATAKDPMNAGNEEGPGDDVVGSQCGSHCYAPWNPPTCEDVCAKVSEGSDDYFQYSVLGDCAPSPSSK